MTGDTTDDEHLLAQLREQASRLVAEVDGPLRRIRMRSGSAVLEIEWHGAPAPNGSAAGPTTLAVSAVAGGSVVTAADRESPDWVVAPMVGTFYRAAEPGAAPFVEVGDLVEPGQVIGIVEAMKLMNHITAEHAGKVAEVLVGNGEPVEFNQPLIALVSA
ncbi:acetyl-CoA carboxylase biotin carboxyl carrier protein [Micromonospora sp. NBC_01796]|uniref:acetyl-CoA carboxylase biotin carboxyl carrier protein n=1 Tax=Micromonospora sp. NBC_01796 TaxID=2975987 RepID=UPI002DD9B077|nr:acetyl-CoA carboxylase biotin carboxyl carrier protein [Micromonospora sp. NBC_01796]WSA85563.1 acetyl-CoA carboxylase biotin carboxyl carrier protein [Micromonospora sp. NBC_01796]